MIGMQRVLNDTDHQYAASKMCSSWGNGTFPSVSVCCLLFRNTGLNLLNLSKYEDSTKTGLSDTYAEAGVGYDRQVFMELS